MPSTAMPSTTPPDTSDPNIYDFILVGAGSAACLLASRLSSALPTHRILVLEAGPHHPHDPKILTPGLSVSLQGDPAYDWAYASAPEPGLGGRRVQHPRGRLVGGTSAINSHSVVYPNREWQDRVAGLLGEKGREVWSAEGMGDCYERWRVEGEGEKERVEGEGGRQQERVVTSFPRSLDVLQTKWTQAFEALGYAPGKNGFVESAPGALTVANAVDPHKGERSHAGTAFLEPALQRANMTLRTGVKVDRVLFADARTADGKLSATGVCYTHEGNERVIRAREVILCAGVFESPAILERSGIGSKKVLDAAGVPCLYDLPGVGENLQDHLNCSLSREVNDDVPTHDDAVRDPDARNAALAEYTQHRTGRLSEGAAYSFAFTPLQMLETAAETDELLAAAGAAVDAAPTPGLKAQYAMLQSAIESSAEATATTFMLRLQRNRDLASLPPGTPPHVPGNFLTLVAMLAHPFSRGSCHIPASSSQTSPDLDIAFNYLSHPLDTALLARHIRLLERLLATAPFATLLKPAGARLPRSFPHPITTLAEARGILAVNAATNYHPCGTCAMMREELGGVVDGKLRVYGTSGVRVCDASVLPVVPRGNILAAVYAWAERGAGVLVGEARGAC